MRIELRVCKHCHEGEHGDPFKTAVTRDMVSLAEQLREHKDLIRVDGVYVTRVEEGEAEGAQALPAFVATFHGDRVQVTDTQLVMEDPEGNLLVYPDHRDILQILTANLAEISEQTPGGVSIDLSEQSEQLLSS